MPDRTIEFGSFSRACPDALLNSSTLFVRPEDISLVSPSPEVATGRILQSTFLGERIEFKLEIAPDLTLMVEAHNQCAYQIGDTVGLSIPSTRFLNPDAE